MALTISFTGKRILVTGGAGGLGKAMVKKLHDDGATVFVADKDPSSIEQLMKECPNVKAVQLDLTNFEETRKVVESFGPLDHLVNNAGISGTQYFVDVDIDKMKKIFDINFNSYVVVGQVVARGMIANKIQGSIVNVSSVAGTQPTKNLGSYCCSKAAVTMLTKIMALELGEHNIRVNCISPSVVDTPITRSVPGSSDEEIKALVDKFLERNIIKRLILPDEVAELIMFLLSPSASMITGENVFIDAGTSIS